MPISINQGRDRLLSEFGKKTLEDRYLLPGESGPQEAFARAAMAFADLKAVSLEFFTGVTTMATYEDMFKSLAANINR